MKTRLLIIALIVVFTLSLTAVNAEARKSKYNFKPKSFVSSEMLNSQISAVQQKLSQLGYNPGPADGVSGSQTTEAIRQFQKDHGLDVDGVVGPATLAALGL